MSNTTTKKSSLWQQYKLPILLLGGIAIGSIIGVVSPAWVKPSSLWGRSS